MVREVYKVYHANEIKMVREVYKGEKEQTLSTRMKITMTPPPPLPLLRYDKSP
jgi:hypothetical protein